MHILSLSLLFISLAACTAPKTSSSPGSSAPTGPSVDNASGNATTPPAPAPVPGPTPPGLTGGVVCPPAAPAAPAAALSLLIAGGVVAVAGDAAATTALGFFDADQIHGGCNGTRVGFNFILVAAHCLTTPETFLIGYVDPTSTTCQKPAFAPATLTSFIINPNFNTANALGDIGLIVVQPVAPGTDPLPGIPIRPVLGFTDSAGNPVVSPGSVLLQAGWGYTPTATAATPSSLNAVLNTVQSLDSTHFELTYVPGTGKGTCDLDSGSPSLQLDSTGAVVGLISIANRGSVDAQGKELACSVGSGIDVDARYYRKWMSCAAAQAMTAFGLSSGITNGSDDSDHSDADCASTAVVSLATATTNAAQCATGTTLSSVDWTTCVAN